MTHLRRNINIGNRSHSPQIIVHKCIEFNHKKQGFKYFSTNNNLANHLNSKYFEPTMWSESRDQHA